MPVDPFARRTAKRARSAVFCVAGVLAGAGLYAANLAYLSAQAHAALVASVTFPGYLTSVALNAKGDTLAAGVNDVTGRHRDRIRLWRVADPAHPVEQGQTPSGAPVSRMAFTPDDDLATDDGKTITLWDVRAWGSDFGLKPTRPHHPSVPKDNTTLVASGQSPKTGDPTGSTTLWNAAHPARPATFDQPPAAGTGMRIPSAAFTPDGTTVAFATGDGDVTLRSTGNPAHLLSRPRAISGKGDWVQSVAFFPRGRTLVTGSFNNTVTLWNVTDPARPVKLSQPLTGNGFVSTSKQPYGLGGQSVGAGTVTLAAVGPDGTTLILGQANGTITRWDVTDPARPVKVGQPIKAGQNLDSVAFTPDGTTLVTGSHDLNATGTRADSRIKLWRL